MLYARARNTPGLVGLFDLRSSLPQSRYCIGVIGAGRKDRLRTARFFLEHTYGKRADVLDVAREAVKPYRVQIVGVGGTEFPENGPHFLLAPSPIATRYPIPVVPLWTYRSELMNEYSGTAVVGSSGTEGASPLEHAPRHKHIASTSAKKESFLILNTSNIKRKYLHFIGQV